MLYLATPSSLEVRRAMADGRLGQLLTADSSNRLEPGAAYAVDNGRYAAWSRRKAWDDRAWRRHLARHAGPDGRGVLGGRFLFAVVPDIVANADATRLEWDTWFPVLAEAGVPAAYVTQDGETPDQVPWDDLAVLFTGGTDQWKMGEPARLLMEEARSRGKATHMGRVNTLDRLKIACQHGYDTADGTFLAYGPDTNLPRLLRYIRTAENHAATEPML